MTNAKTLEMLPEILLMHMQRRQGKSLVGSMHCPIEPDGFVGARRRNKRARGDLGKLYRLGWVERADGSFAFHRKHSRSKPVLVHRNSRHSYRWHAPHSGLSGVATTLRAAMVAAMAA